MRLLVPRWLLHPRPLWEVVWRLLERRSGRPEAETTGGPSYAYGKVTGLSPDVTVMTETTESPYVCCGYCSAGMACRVARSGLDATMKPTAHSIRSAGGRPHDNGNNATELRDGADDAFGVKLKARAVSELPDRLRAGDAVTVGLDYAQLPSYLRVQGGDFGHAVMLRGWDGSGSTDLVGFFDPLWPQGARGAWAKWPDVKAALWGDGNHSSVPARVDEPEPPDPPKPPPYRAEPEQPHAVEIDRAYGYGRSAGQDAALVDWLGWLEAAGEVAGRWDEARWEPAPLVDLDELEDECGGAIGSTWGRGPVPDPVQAARHALATSSTWSGDGRWGGGLWR